MKQIILLCGVFLLSIGVSAQIKTPSLSPSAKAVQTVGLTEFMVEYSRPSKRGRALFGANGLVPNGKIWRTGANAVTKISFDTDVFIEGVEFKKGEYAILTLPNASTWEVMLYPYESRNWGSYVEKEPAGKFSVESVKLPVELETFTIFFDEMQDHGKATMEIVWGNTAVPMKIDTKVDADVEKNIETVLNGPSASDYYAAGSYYLETGKNLETALAYVQKATKGDNPRFWQLRKEALILAELGRYSDAVKVAKQSQELATEAGNDDYVKLNADSIKEWMMK